MSRQFKMAVSSADDAPNTAPLLLLGSIRDNLITAAKMGYDAIEIHMRENAQPDFEEIAATCAKHKVKISAVVSGRLAVQENISITDEDPMKREKAVSGLYDYITLAQKLETDIIIGWIRGKTCAPRTKKQYNDLLAHSLKPLSDEAKKKNVRLFIEAINRYEIDTCNTAYETLSLIEEYGLENVYVHLDTFHMNIEETDIARAVTDCGARLGYIHIADSNRRYPGAGHINFIPILEALEKINYQGYVSVECLPYPDGVTAAKNAINFIKSMNWQ